MRHGFLHVCGALMCAAPMVAARADSLNAPLALTDRAPLAQIHGLPEPRSGEVLAAGQTALRLSFDVANNFELAQQDGETLTLDGENHRLGLSGRVGIGDGWELGVAVPLIHNSGGFLDSFIEGWHRFWGLPQGGRPSEPRNRLQYAYVRDGVSELDVTRARAGVGDTEITLARSLWQDGTAAVALAATLKLPTGAADRLTGDGASATDLTLAASTGALFGTALHGYANAGMLWLPTGDVLPDQQQNSIWHVAGGLSWPVSDALALKVQLDAHRAFYRSKLRALGADSVLAVIGGSARLGPHWLLDAGVGEDIRVDTAPDVTLQLALRWVR